jgi:cell division protein FtsB
MSVSLAAQNLARVVWNRAAKLYRRGRHWTMRRRKDVRESGKHARAQVKLGGERQVKKRSVSFDFGKRLTLACSLLLVVTAAGIGNWYYSLNQRSAQVDVDIASAQQEQARLQSIIREVAAFNQQRAQLQQRVTLIEELRRNQTGPVHMLDQISRALPEMLWLTALKQSLSDSNEVLIDGLATSPTTCGVGICASSATSRAT